MHDLLIVSKLLPDTSHKTVFHNPNFNPHFAAHIAIKYGSSNATILVTL